MPSVRIIYRDDDLVVVDKPAGLAVHRGWAPERDVVMTRVRDALGAFVYPVHRLDRGASGVLVMALHPDAARALCDCFASGCVEKRYLALVRGVPDESGTIDHPLPAGEDRNGPRVAATTDFVRLEVLGRYSLIEAWPRSGRLHQIRRHLKHISCPLIGDVRYGKGEHNRLFRAQFQLHRMFLHAKSIRLPHPADGHMVEVTAALAPELETTLALLRNASRA